jgi:hypothetical protein
MFHLVWSRVNQAWFVLFGSGNLSECSLLAVKNDKPEALALLADWGVTNLKDHSL